MKCASCNRDYPASRIEFHHWLFGKDKNNPEFCNNPVNVVPCCVHCHATTNGNPSDQFYASALGEQFQEKMMRRAIETCGLIYIREWLNSCPQNKQRGAEYRRAVVLLERLGG